MQVVSYPSDKNTYLRKIVNKYNIIYIPTQLFINWNLIICFSWLKSKKKKNYLGTYRQFSNQYWFCIPILFWTTPTTRYFIELDLTQTGFLLSTGLVFQVGDFYQAKKKKKKLVVLWFAKVILLMPCATRWSDCEM